MVMVLFTLILAHTPAFSHISVEVEKTYIKPVPSYSVEDIKDRLDNLSSVIDIEYTHEVGRRIREYTVDYRVSGEKILGKVDLFFPIFDQEIARRGLPEELKFVAVVESHLNPRALSKSGASGLWQFMKSTARMQGLVINEIIDERRDPVKSTAAALDYLEFLHESFGDWTLAIAAYNCGPGNVRKAIRRGNSKDYWTIRKHMPRETQKYVPRVIAAMYLMQYYHEHNLEPKAIHEDLKFTIEINDGQHHNFKTLAKSIDVEYELLRSLNPQYKQSYFPKNSGRLILSIPVSAHESYMKKYNPVTYKKYLEKQELELAEIEAARKEEELLKYKREKIDPIERIEGLVIRNLYSFEEQVINISL